MANKTAIEDYSELTAHGPDLFHAEFPGGADTLRKK
jgi:hypothetical protein